MPAAQCGGQPSTPAGGQLTPALRAVPTEVHCWSAIPCQHWRRASARDAPLPGLTCNRNRCRFVLGRESMSGVEVCAAHDRIGKRSVHIQQGPFSAVPAFGVPGSAAARASNVWDYGTLHEPREDCSSRRCCSAQSWHVPSLSRRQRHDQCLKCLHRHMCRSAGREISAACTLQSVLQRPLCF